MSIPFLFSSGIIVVLLVAAGLFYTFKEFRDMTDQPEAYRFNRSEDPKVISGSDDS